MSHLRRSICSSQSLIPASQPGPNGPSGLKSPPLPLCRCRGRRVQLEVRVTSHKYGHVFRPSGAKTGVSEANPRGRRGTTIRTRAGVAGSPRAPAAAGGAFVYCNIPGVRFGSPPSKLPAPFQGARAYLTKDVPVFMEPCAWSLALIPLHRVPAGAIKSWSSSAAGETVKNCSFKPMTSKQEGSFW